MKKTYDEPTAEAYAIAEKANSEATRTLNSTGAEQRAADRTTAEHEREARRDETSSGIIEGTGAATEKEADGVKTAIQNQSDKVATGVANTEDRIKNQ